MPLSPISILVGGTIAAIGSAYVFKKFVYDPHLAPFVEALLAQHDAYYHDHHHQQRYQDHENYHPSGRHAVPIPVSSSSIATTSSRQQHRTCQPGGALRRRSMRRDSNEYQREYEYDRDLLSRDELLGEERGIELRNVKRRRRSVDTLPAYREDDTAHTAGQYGAGSSSTEIASPRAAATIIPVFAADALDNDDADLHAPMHHVLRAPNACPHSSTPPQDNAYLSVGQERQHDYAQASTAFSILSLSQSQIDSPESPSAVLASMHLQRPLTGEPDSSRSPLASSVGLEMSGMLVPHPSVEEDARDAVFVDDGFDNDDIISLADTDDMGTGVYSLPSRAISPATFSPAVAPRGIAESQTLTDLGMSWTRTRTMSPTFASLPGATRLGSPSPPPISLVLPPFQDAAGLRRSPMSVVSLSESEGWGSAAGSEWDGLADEHPV